MIYVISVLLNMFSSWVPGTKDDEQREDKRTILPEAHEKCVKSAASVDSIADDIKRLEAEYGPFTDGMSLTVELKHLLVFCPRSRRRKDAYKKLRKELLREKGGNLNY